MNFACGVVVVAAGSGSRMGGEVPKQFRALLGRPLLLWATTFFDRQPEVREIVVVVPAQWFRQAEEMCACADHAKRWRVVQGGVRRQDSVIAGLRALSPDIDLAAVHDAARPFPPAGFSAGVESARQHRAAIFAWPVNETVKRVDGGRIVETIDRSTLWSAQTPQIFERDLLQTALEQSLAAGSEVTDEAMAVELAGVSVRIVCGSRTNLKITTPEDWTIAEALARLTDVWGPMAGEWKRETK